MINIIKPKLDFKDLDLSLDTLSQLGVKRPRSDDNRVDSFAKDTPANVKQMQLNVSF